MSAGVAELAPGRYAIRAETGDRLLFAYLVRDGDEALLIDSGEQGTAVAAILPALGELGVAPGDLRRIVITHPDVDHQGGLARVLAYAAGAQVLCGFEDRAMVADPEQMVQQRYRAYTEHGLDYDAEQLAGIRDAYGAAVAIDRTLLGGERLRVGGIELRVHPGPGHSAGHLMLEDPEHGLLFISDAVHGRGSPAIGGGAALPPTYEDVDAYLGTIERVRRIGPERVFSGHFEPLAGAEIGAFLDESAAFVAAMDDFLLARLDEAASGLAGLCSAAAAEFGPFTAPDFFFMFAVHGHLRRLARSGRVVPRPAAGDRAPSFARGSG